jgi:trehalose-6-phosphate synthase
MSLKWDESTGDVELGMNSGGLVSALLGIKNIDMTWIGWTGSAIEDTKRQEQVRAKLRKMDCEPIFLSEGQMLCRSRATLPEFRSPLQK